MLNTSRIANEMREEAHRLRNAANILEGSTSTPQHRRGRRHLSASAKKRISDAMKKRWAERKRTGKKGPLGVSRSLARAA